MWIDTTCLQRCVENCCTNGLCRGLDRDRHRERDIYGPDATSGPHHLGRDSSMRSAPMHSAAARWDCGYAPQLMLASCTSQSCHKPAWHRPQTFRVRRSLDAWLRMPHRPWRRTVLPASQSLGSGLAFPDIRCASRSCHYALVDRTPHGLPGGRVFIKPGFSPLFLCPIER
jgi:hypothetical protein